MNQEDELLTEKAEKLAAQPYAVQVSEEIAPDGQSVFFAKNPQLPGCVAQGPTRKAALRELEDAREAYIHSLLLDGLDVPAPNYSVSTGADATYIWSAYHAGLVHTRTL